MSKEVTIYDIAESAGVSSTTVSRALNDHPAVNEKTKKRIYDIASEMGYRFNVFASNLRSKKTNNIGVIVPRLNSNFQSSVLAGMEKVASQSGYNLIISQSFESFEKEKANVKTMYNSRVDGLLVSLAANSITYDHFKPFLEKNIPVLFFDRIPLNTQFAGVMIDNVQAGYNATAHLIKEGCKRIVHVLGNGQVNVYLDRLKGYRYALIDQGLEYLPELVFHTDFTEENFETIVDFILQHDEIPDGLFVSNDIMAAGCISELKERGLQVPEDIAVMGFNNDVISRLIEPKLSTTNYPGFEMGELAMRNLINHLNSSDGAVLQNTDTITLRSELIIRKSSLKSQQTLVQ
ncbi:LacI family DNA-binding transcriptional regulator [Algoriphagus sp. NG3]|uniref:LacI family DNA-binding transcriptional regulator n=1 Tax=Algoriphagus sp. NG3 TaxID=3097546 RepID=UPI002A8197BB|nr:LacI family DNA-binding transcriptional regulator [Algoriphagus sp. NG3]WPR76752.1 LacI family DNA-binding transcriptional regulator [Algoriphagus sp. NG3]